MARIVKGDVTVVIREQSVGASTLDSETLRLCPLDAPVLSVTEGRSAVASKL